MSFSLLSAQVVPPWGELVSITTPAGGSWTSQTISVRIVFWLSASESDTDFAGWDVGSSYNGIAIANSDKLVIEVKTPTRPYHHVSIYYQVASTYTDGSTGTKLADLTPGSEDNGTLVYLTTAGHEGNLQITIPASDNLGSFTTQTTRTFVDFSPVIAIVPTCRDNSIQTYNGYWIKNNQVFDSLTSEVTITLPLMACSDSDYKKVLKWQTHSIPLALIDTEGSYITAYYGVISDNNYLMAKNKGSNGETFDIKARIYAETHS